MMLFRSVLCVVMLAMACSSSRSNKNQPRFSNLITLNPPGKQKTVASKIYVDSVKFIDYKKEKALLISGNMANGCTYISEASHTSTDETLQLSLKAWKPADKICSQALVPFSFIYDKLSQQELDGYNAVVMNQKSFKIEHE